MLNDVKKVIQEIYIYDNKELFISSCKKEISFLDEFLETVKAKVLNSDIYTNSNEPMLEIRFCVNNYMFHGEEIEYTSILLINKIIDYFYLQHEFSLDNPDPDRMGSLDGFGDQAYNKKQFDLEEKIVSYLKSKGYNRLSYADMEEVFPGIRKFEGRDEINQMTVNNALFMDMWDLCNGN